jgi:hypothetical protein
MAWPTYTIADLATMTGRPEASFTSYANMAIAKAMLLFKLATCLQDWPSDALGAELAQYAVLSVADLDYLAQPNAVAMASPFQSESIGSYSYSKMLKQVQAGFPTGLGWFDTAIQQLGICGIDGGFSPGVISGSLSVFEEDGLFFTDTDGKRKLLGPADIEPLWIAPFVSGQDPG